MLSGDENQHMTTRPNTLVLFLLCDQLKNNYCKTKSTRGIDSFPLAFLHLFERICETDGSMSAETKKKACSKGYAKWLGSMSAKAKSEGYTKGLLGSMSV